MRVQRAAMGELGGYSMWVRLVGKGCGLGWWVKYVEEECG